MNDFLWQHSILGICLLATTLYPHLLTQICIPSFSGKTGSSGSIFLHETNWSEPRSYISLKAGHRPFCLPESPFSLLLGLGGLSLALAAAQVNSQGEWQVVGTWQMLVPMDIRLTSKWTWDPVGEKASRVPWTKCVCDGSGGEVKMLG